MMRPRFGMRLGTMLLLVLTLGAGMAPERFRARWAYCRAVAGQFREDVDFVRGRLKSQEAAMEADANLTLDDKEAMLQYIKINARDAAELEARIGEFHRASFMPWLPVPKGPHRIARPDY